MAIHFAGTLPPGALVAVRQQSDPAPIWFRAEPASMVFSQKHPDRVVTWRSADNSGLEAHAVAANKIGTLFRPEPASLLFEAEANGGLILPEVIADASRATFGMIFLPEPSEEPRTLLSLQVRGADDYLFVSGEGGAFRAAQKSGATELAVAHETGRNRPMLLIFALSGSKMMLAVNGNPAMSAEIDHPPAGRADLFIGCRNARAGLRRKLGRYGLTDVMVWPGQDLLSDPDNPALNLAKSLLKARCANVD